MPLCIPTIVSPVSELSTSLRIQGALPRANITISSVGTNPRDIAKGIAKGGDDRINLLPGITLQNGDILVAEQQHEGAKSHQTPKEQGSSVQPLPKDPAELDEFKKKKYVGFNSHLYACGEYLWIAGAIPGATVEVEFDGSSKGSAVALEGDARLKLSKGLPECPESLPKCVSTWQSIPSGKGPSATGTPDPVKPRELRPPIIKKPIFACQTAVLVSDVYDGSTVTLQRDGSVFDAGFDMSALWLGLNKPLDELDSIVVKQNLWAQCSKIGIKSSEMKVDKTSNIQAPVIIPPLCAGSPFVPVANLVPGASVSIKVNRTVWRAMAPPNTTIYSFMVDPLPEGTVSAIQELCSISSPESSLVPIDPHEIGSARKIKIIEPLYDCARVVFVQDARFGSMLQVWRKEKRTGKEASISDKVMTAYDHGTDNVPIPVTPYLNENDEIWVLNWACGSTDESNHAKVLPHPTIEPPKIFEPIYSYRDSRVIVIKYIPGASIDVYHSTQEGVWSLAGRAFGSSVVSFFPTGPEVATTVPLNVEILKAGDKLRATQAICKTMTEPGPVVTVLRGGPSKPEIIAPADTATGIDRKPVLSWRDPSSGPENRADSYELGVKRDSTVILPNTPTTITNYPITTDLEYSTTYSWYVTAKNTSGSNTTVASFKVKEAPPPPPPVIDSYDVKTFTLLGKQFQPSHTVYINLNVEGTLINAYGVAIYDRRTQKTVLPLKFSSDSSGKLLAVIVPKDILDPLYLSNIEGYLTGLASGEQLSFIANDERPSETTSDHILWSNRFTVTWP